MRTVQSIVLVQWTALIVSYRFKTFHYQYSLDFGTCTNVCDFKTSGLRGWFDWPSHKVVVRNMWWTDRHWWYSTRSGTTYHEIEQCAGWLQWLACRRCNLLSHAIQVEQWLQVCVDGVWWGPSAVEIAADNGWPACFASSENWNFWLLVIGKYLYYGTFQPPVVNILWTCITMQVDHLITQFGFFGTFLRWSASNKWFHTLTIGCKLMVIICSEVFVFIKMFECLLYHMVWVL